MSRVMIHCKTPFLMALLLTPLVLNASLRAATPYYGVDLYPLAPNALNASLVPAAFALHYVAGGQIVGATSTFPNNAAVWNLPNGATTNIHPTNLGTVFESAAVGTDGVRQVGFAEVGTRGNVHAVLWSGFASSAVDLHPTLSGTNYSTALDVSGSQQVGYRGVTSSFYEHAVVWNGTRESAVDLHPTQFAGLQNSRATATDGVRQVGFMTLVPPSEITGFRRAVLWNGTAASATNLHPVGYSSSIAQGVGGGQQVGAGGTNLGASRALLWSGTSSSVIDLHPTDAFSNSGAIDTNGTHQVGWSDDYAFLWNGSASSAVNLHESLPAGFRKSTAYSIDAQGSIWGLAQTSDFTWHAVMWMPVPEPSMFGLVVSACLASAVTQRASRLRRRRSSR